MKRGLFAIVIGLGGLAILLWLGAWQVQRLAWKETLLAEIDSRIAAAPIALPAAPDRDADRYLPVSAQGRFKAEPRIRMLASRRQIGAVHRQIAVFDAEGVGSILVDLGWTPDDVAAPPLPEVPLTLIGNLDWPNETDGFTPAPEGDLIFARDVDDLAQTYGTLPVMIVLREMPETNLGVTPWPVDSAGIPNDHLQYAITWFSLAAIWVGMTVYFIIRQRRLPQKD